MQALSTPSKTAKHQVPSARLAMISAFSVVGLFRVLWPGRSPSKTELDDDNAVLQDAHGSMRCGNPDRSWRLLSEWLRSRGDEPEDYGVAFRTDL